ncbi:MAG: hypothetical protein P1U85_21220 [Verrucomicrobiales bacterium]|nr:hypothetical protein [Verrucomicrobiales bacterium]
MSKIEQIQELIKEEEMICFQERKLERLKMLKETLKILQEEQKIKKEMKTYVKSINRKEKPTIEYGEFVISFS